MLWILVFFGIFGLLNFIFAFVEPPRFLSSFFKIPAIFVFLPDRMVVPAGRLFVGLCCFVVVAILYFKVGPAGM
jgi:hypothetical protein